MRKNPGRKEHRNLITLNRTKRSRKKQAINERNMLWLSKYGPNWREIRCWIELHSRKKQST